MAAPLKDTRGRGGEKSDDGDPDVRSTPTKHKEYRVHVVIKTHSCCGFFPLSGYPPTPLMENHFAKKPLAERGGTPPPTPTLTENPPKKI